MPLNAEYYYYGDTWNHSSFLCGFWIVTDIVVSTGSIWTLAVIALDRLWVRLVAGMPQTSLSVCGKMNDQRKDSKDLNSGKEMHAKSFSSQQLPAASIE